MDNINYKKIASFWFGFLGRLVFGGENDARKGFEAACPGASKSFIDFIVANRTEIRDTIGNRYKDEYKAAADIAKEKYKKSGKWDKTVPLDYGDGLDEVDTLYGQKIYNALVLFHSNGRVMRPKQKTSENTNS